MTKIDYRIKISVITLGITAIITQIILLREFLSVFYGNELVIGIILANWMLITGAGSYLAKYAAGTLSKPQYIIIIQIIVSALPVITVFLLYYLRNILFPAGSMVSIVNIFLYSFILLTPFCLLSGFLFTFFCRYVSGKYGSNLIGKIYSIESFGSITGGLLFNFILIYAMDTFRSLTLLMIINLAAALILAFFLKNRSLKYLIIILIPAITAISLYYDADHIAIQFFYKDQEIIHDEDTPYGNIVVTQSEDQKNIFENGAFLFSSDNVIANEENVHYAMVQHHNPKEVLLLSGGISGITGEILKYDINNIDYLEINPRLIDIAGEYFSYPDNKKVTIINKDARLYIKTTEKMYDVVLICLPEPGTAQINRYYTLEFLKELKQNLTKDAVICLGLPSTANYVSEAAGQVNSVIYNTLVKIFDNILIIPGEKNFFLASDNTLSINIVERVEEKQLDNIYVNRYYLDDKLLEDRSRYITGTIDTDAGINKDFTPVSYYDQLVFRLSYFKINFWVLAGAFLVLLALIISRINYMAFGMFTGGFAALSIEFILLISFQIIYGYVYHVTGIIITVFMAGLALGALYFRKLFPGACIRDYYKIQFFIGIYSVIVPFVLICSGYLSANVIIIHAIFFLLTLIISLLTGMEFSIASVIYKKELSSAAADLYGADLAGSAFGALITAAFMFPVLGIVPSCIIIGCLNFLSGTVVFLRNK